jgi:hypothetical protein
VPARRPEPAGSRCSSTLWRWVGRSALQPPAAITHRQHHYSLVALVESPTHRRGLGDEPIIATERSCDRRRG